MCLGRLELGSVSNRKVKNDLQKDQNEKLSRENWILLCIGKHEKIIKKNMM